MKRNAYTLVELLVVVSVLAVLVAMAVLAGRTLIRGSKIRETATELNALSIAAHEYTRQVSHLRIPGLDSPSPPDRLDVFAEAETAPYRYTTGGRFTRRVPEGTIIDVPPDTVEYPTIRAFLLACRLRSLAACQIIDHLSDDKLRCDDLYYTDALEMDTPALYRVDAWNTPIVYAATGGFGSAGPDRAWNTPDDVIAALRAH